MSIVHCVLQNASLNNFSQKLDIFAFDLLNGAGDFLDISKYLFKDRRPDINTLTKEQLQSMVICIPTAVLIRGVALVL